MKGTIEFLTETGSRYRVDYDHRIWIRFEQTTRSGVIRANGGNLLHYPAVIVGQPCTMVDDAILPDMDAHYVVTSRVLKAEWFNSKEAPNAKANGNSKEAHSKAS